MPVPQDRNMIHPAIKPCLEVLEEGKVGLFAGRVKIEEMSCGNFSTERNAAKERLKLTIPFAGQSIQWSVNFDSRHPEIPPDFSFSDENFLAGIDISILKENLPTMMNWNMGDPRGMLNLVQELLVLYRNFQIQQLKSADGRDRNNESRMHARASLKSLLDSSIVSDEDLEVLAGRRELDPIYIMVRLAVDLSSLPESVHPAGSTNPGDDVAALLITFPSTSSGRTSAQLFLSPTIDEILGGNKNLQIPSFTKNDHLPDYVNTIKLLLGLKIDAITSNFNKRRMFLETLLNQMGRASIEYDSVNFTSISFLMEWNNFYFVVQACLPQNFPEDKPTYLFQSVYHTHKDKPFVTKCSDYPYSPRWDAVEMADRAKAFILDYVETFQRKSIRTGQQF